MIVSLLPESNLFSPQTPHFHIKKTKILEAEKEKELAFFACVKLFNHFKKLLVALFF